METILHTKGLTKIYSKNENKVYALNNLNIEIKKGEFTVLNGRSGSGKTTLINMLGTLDTPTSGEIWLGETDITQISEHQKDKIRKSQVGFIFQSVALMSLMTAYENVELGLRISGYSLKNRKEHVLECLKMVGLEKKVKNRPIEMSGGEQQRIAIARTIATNPQIIFADEPTAELDTHNGLSIVKILKMLVKENGVTIVMTTHDPEMMSIADRVYTLQDGEIIDEKTEAQ